MKFLMLMLFPVYCYAAAPVTVSPVATSYVGNNETEWVEKIASSALTIFGNGDSLNEDTVNMEFWDGTFDRVYVKYSDAFYSGSALNITGSVMVAVRALHDSAGVDTLRAGMTVQYGIMASSLVHWYDTCDTLFWYDDTLSSGLSIVDTRYETFFLDAPQDTTYDGKTVLANVVRYISYLPDSSYCNDSLVADLQVGHNGTRVLFEIIPVKIDSAGN